LKNKGDQISGFSDGVDAYDLFRSRLKAHFPELLEKADEEMARIKKKRKWVEDTEPSEFSFNFFS
jgi:hypothetical protein